MGQVTSQRSSLEKPRLQIDEGTSVETRTHGVSRDQSSIDSSPMSVKSQRPWYSPAHDSRLGARRAVEVPQEELGVGAELGDDPARRAEPCGRVLKGRSLEDVGRAGVALGGRPDPDLPRRVERRHAVPVRGDDQGFHDVGGLTEGPLLAEDLLHRTGGSLHRPDEYGAASEVAEDGDAVVGCP
jgi:hypothetical protein